MSNYTITVVRGGGERVAIPVNAAGLDGVFGQALRRAQDLVVHGCPFGDAIPPQRVEIRTEGGDMVISIVIDESLRPLQ